MRLSFKRLYSDYLVSLVSLASALLIYLFVNITINSETARIIQLTQLYALIAVFALYSSLIITPLKLFFPKIIIFKNFPGLRNNLIISTVIFASLHSYFAFFDELGGFEGLGFLSQNYLIPVGLGFFDLAVLVLMSSLLIPYLVNKFKFLKSPWLLQTIYFAGLGTLIHALMLGSHFTRLNTAIPIIFFILLIFFLFLESLRLDKYLKSRFKSLPAAGIPLIIIVASISAGSVFIYTTTGASDSPLNVHSAHIELAKQAQKGNLGGSSLPDSIRKIPGFSGDPTKRYSVSFIHPERIEPNTDTNLKFEVYDANSGSKTSYFQINYDKIVHLVVVDSELKYFAHIHPVQTEKGFEITASFPHPGQYRLYTNFLPTGAIEQQFAFSLNVGDFDKAQFSESQDDSNQSKIFGDYEVSMEYPKPLKADQLSIGAQTITFNIKDAKTGSPVTNLKPYLAAFGHLVMINEKSLDYLHVHPSNLTSPKPNESSGPKVDFLPLGLYGPIKPGLYRIFAQFNPDNKLFTADFTVNIQ